MIVESARPARSRTRSLSVQVKGIGGLMTRVILRFGALLPIYLVAILAVISSADAEPRTAFIVGNAGYSWAPLKNPVNDANDVAAALRGAGFDVILKTDADQRGLRDGVRAFGEALKA